MSRTSRSETSAGNRRGQLVLVAAATIAVALVPMVVAYVQLGYHADVDAAGAHQRPGTDAERALDRAVHNASSVVVGEYEWSERGDAVDEVNRTLDPFVRRIERSRLESSVAYEITQNATVAATWADENCPSGPNRDFGTCETRGGVVVQERAGETHVLAVVFDVRVTSERGETDLSFVFDGV